MQAYDDKSDKTTVANTLNTLCNLANFNTNTVILTTNQQALTTYIFQTLYFANNQLPISGNNTPSFPNCGMYMFSNTPSDIKFHPDNSKSLTATLDCLFPKTYLTNDNIGYGSLQNVAAYFALAPQWYVNDKIAAADAKINALYVKFNQAEEAASKALSDKLIQAKAKVNVHIKTLTDQFTSELQKIKSAMEKNVIKISAHEQCQAEHDLVNTISHNSVATVAVIGSAIAVHYSAPVYAVVLAAGLSVSALNLA